MNNLLYFRGIPTDADVQKLIDAFGVPREGDRIPYADIQAQTGMNREGRGRHRWGAVISAWRKRLERENNIILKAEAGRAYVALNGSGRVELCGSTYKRGLRRIARAVDIAGKTERMGLTAEESRVLDHVAKNGAALRLAAITAARELRVEAN